MTPTKRPETYAPMQRSRECEREQNRRFRRQSTHMTEGQRRKEMRLMYVEIGKFALKSGDIAIRDELLAKYECYTRVDRPISTGIKTAHYNMCRWYDAVRNDYIAAHYEDIANDV